MERPDFFTLKNGEKAKLPFSNKEYDQRVNKLRLIMEKQLHFLTMNQCNTFGLLR